MSPSLDYISHISKEEPDFWGCNHLVVKQVCVSCQEEEEDNELDSDEGLGEQEEAEEEEEEEERDDDSSETLVLGQEQVDKKDKKRKRDDDKSTDEKPDAGETAAAPNLRSLYWQVVHEAQKMIKKENPKMKPKEVLSKARAVHLICNILVMSQATHSMKMIRIASVVGLGFFLSCPRVPGCMHSSMY